MTVRILIAPHPTSNHKKPSLRVSSAGLRISAGRTVNHEVAMASLEKTLNLLKGCASTEAHNFDVEGMDIGTAFNMHLDLSQNWIVSGKADDERAAAVTPF